MVDCVGFYETEITGMDIITINNLEDKPILMSEFQEVWLSIITEMTEKPGGEYSY